MTKDPGGRSLIAREGARRRAILLGIAVLILLVISPIFSHHLFRGTEVMLAGRDHIGALCLIALHALLSPIHTLLHLLFVGGVLYAGLDRGRTWLRGRRILGALDVERPVPGEPFWEAAHAAGVDPSDIRVASGLPTPAFTVGWVRPKIYIARSLPDLLEPEQLIAVISHEGAHAARRDPLRLSLLRFLTCTLFWLPALRRLAADITDEAEIQADDVAAQHRPLALAGAILTLAGVGDPRSRQVAGVSFHHPALLQRRVRRLAGEDPALGSHLDRRSIVAAAAALALVFVSGAVMAHPVPVLSDSAGNHCPHHTHESSFRQFDLRDPYGFIGHRCDPSLSAAAAEPITNARRTRHSET